MGEKSRLCRVWVGAETGILKGISPAKKQAFNFSETSSLSRDQEVRVLCWGDPAETEVLVGSVNGTVRTFSTEKGVFTETRQCGDADQGFFTGLAVADCGLVTCVETGRLRVWREESSSPVVDIDAGKNVCRMRQNAAQKNRVATGGKENGLKIWDLERPDTPVFTAKNLRDDWIGLKQPEWLRDAAFLPDSDKIVTCTGHHQVRVYDPSTPQRRPVLEVRYGEYPLTCLSLVAGAQSVVVGNTHGSLAVLDLRKGLVRGCLKGLQGGVRGLQCHPTLPLVASCGLDRFLRIHSLETRALEHKVYLKSRLNCLLLSSGALGEEVGGDVEEVKEEEDELWQSMEKVEEKSKRKAPEEEEEEEAAVEEEEEEAVEVEVTQVTNSKRKKKKKGQK